MKKTMALVVSCLLTLSMGLTGCGGNNSGTKEGAQSKKDEKVTIRFSTWDSGDMLKCQQDIAKKFEESHPNIKVQVEAYSDGFDQKLIAAFGAKNAPDVTYMWNFPKFYKSLEPLTEYIKDESLDLDDIYPGLLNYNKIDGVVYGLPAGFTSHVVYYNKKIFDDAGTPYPKSGWTWDDLIDVAKKLTKPEEKQYGYGFSATPDPYDFEQFLWSNGTSYISPDGKEIDGYMNSKEAVEVLQMFIDIGYNDKCALISGGGNKQSAYDIFKSGKLAMYESGIWPMNTFKEAGVDIGVVELPAFPGKTPKTVVSESALAISKDSKHKDAAWEFVKYYTSEEAVRMRVGDLPVRKSVSKAMKLEDDPLYKPFFNILDGADNTPSFLLNPKWGEIQHNLSIAIETALLGKGDPKELLDRAVKESQRFLEN